MRHLFFSKGLFLGLAALSGLASGPAAANPSILFDVRTGQVLEHEDAFKRWHPASLTKIMTAYVAFRAVKAGEVSLQSPIKMTKISAAEPPSKMGFKPGSVMTLDNALKMMLGKSANDIAAAVGENIGGTIPAFADRMNAEAQRLGMTGSHFTNPNGLHDPENYTTARDLALLVRAIRTEFPQYASYFSIEGITTNGKNRIHGYNPLLGRFAGADGMKTGFVCASGYNLIGSATREGRTLAAVVLGERTPWGRADHAADLLGQGFSTSTAGSVTLSSLQPYGEGQTTPTDMRDIVCSKEGASERSDGLDAKGRPKFKSPYMVDLKRELQFVRVGLGGATGPVPAAFAAIDAKNNKADVPIPTWRPDKPAPGVPVSAQGDATQQ
ncbi:D-alanyl-D-alanine carboxypeptidase family protein [Pseudaminobacter soli (ex Li et al. 2025)]|uniref:D-alanyl-D-alanine carboxypeptidase n=1 Tax=Pseudaminobacter soli (ex Li et al. 2025) TaxID=1295366 RepID=A0A2P7SAP9_9HYPH|nr:D-alanyl-D-alanine carboxypeptidase family protein [Mesorhizobium soli]PSJ59395.1 D-alanyl-D-alanine carboxypeptidase [Mesorhizobium soli]